MTETLSSEKHLAHWYKLDEICALERATILVTGEEDVIPDTIIADIDIWRIALTSEGGKLITASATRCGSEGYSFERSPDEENILASSNTGNRFLSPHLHNMATMVVGEEVNWRIATTT